MNKTTATAAAAEAPAGTGESPGQAFEEAP